VVARFDALPREPAARGIIASFAHPGWYRRGDRRNDQRSGEGATPRPWPGLDLAPRLAAHSQPVFTRPG
jgi:hypothetical protein